MVGIFPPPQGESPSIVKADKEWDSLINPPWLKPYTDFFFGILLFVIVLAMFATAVNLSDDFFHWKYFWRLFLDMKPAENRLIFSTVLALSVWVFGYCLFKFRQRQKFWYGALEVLVAPTLLIGELLSSVASASVEDKLQVVGIKMVAALYFTVRGLSNVQEGIKEARTTASEPSSDQPLSDFLSLPESTTPLSRPHGLPLIQNSTVHLTEPVPTLENGAAAIRHAENR
jgi:hypothetical protein